MTTSKTPRNPNPPTDEELEARLQASWGRSVARAEDDLARGDLVPSALAAGRRRQPRRVAGGAMLGVAAVLVVGFALVVGSGARREPVEPPASPAGPVGSPVAPGSPAPDASTPPGEGEGTPILGPGVSFPPTVDGQAVVTVGPEADASIAAATDDSPIYVSGWLVDGDWGWTQCSQASRGVPAPDGTLGPDCIGTLLRAAADGGPALRIFSTVTERPSLARPGPARVQPVLVQVHVRDPRCDGPECARMPVLDRVLLYGAMRVAPGILAATLPPGGISAEQAVDIARNQIQRYPPPEPEQLPLLRVVVGTGAWLDDSSDRYDRWEWVVHLVSDDGYTEYVVSVDYLDGTYLGTGGSGAGGVAPTPVLDPGETFPPTVDGQAVVTVGPETDARIASATDASPIYVSGWILGPDPHRCPGFDSGSPAPNGVMWKDCSAIPLRATEDGGATLPIHVSWAAEAQYPSMPDVTHVLPVLVRVHSHDVGCAADDCAHKAVLDTVVQYGTPKIAPALRTMTLPPGGITMEQALKAADPYIQQNLIGYGLPLVLLSAEAGPLGLVGQGSSMSELDWVWAMRYVTESGLLECWVYVGYLDAIAHESSCESVSFP